MLEYKLLEVRDRATRIDVLAVCLDTDDITERKILKHNGYSSNSRYVILTNLDSGESRNDPFKWGTNPRTMFLAHEYIIAHWNDIPSNWVVDCEYIASEVSEMKYPERYDDTAYDYIYFEFNETAAQNSNTIRVLKDVYKLESARVVDGELGSNYGVKIKKDEIKAIGNQIYEVINRYFSL